MLRTDDTTVAALARRLRVGWNTLWRAVAIHARSTIDDESRLGKVSTLGSMSTSGNRPTVATVEHAALDPFRGYANAIRDELPDAVAVLDAFHVVRLGVKALDETRQRVQQQTLGHRGRKDDPLYKICLLYTSDAADE